jgi:hypothetical protein
MDNKGTALSKRDDELAELRRAMSFDPGLTVLSSEAFDELLAMGEKPVEFSPEAKEAVRRLRAMQASKHE